MKKGRMIAILSVIGISISLYFAPRQPKSAIVANPESNGVSEIDKAIALIEDGTNPMQGIGLLKEMEMEDSTHWEVVWLLAKYSLMSGQTEKAMPRLARLSEQEAEAYPEAVLLYARGLVETGQREAAQPLLKELVQTCSDSVIVDNARNLLKNLSSIN